MQAARIRTAWFVAMTLCAALAPGTPGVSTAVGQETSPADVLKAQGLKRSGTIWIVAEEANVRKGIQQTRAVSAQLRNAQEQQQALAMGDQNPQNLIDGYRQQIEMMSQRIAAYDQELANLGPSGGNQNAAVYHNLLVGERNAIVNEQNRLGNLINNLANQRGQFQEMKQQFNAEVARVREAYLQGIADAKAAVEKITAKYAELGAKPEVVKALKDLSASTKSTQKLGPSKELAAEIQWLSKLEGSVQSEAVPLEREGGVDHVQVMLNGKGPFKMVFDTGAGLTTVPSGLATQLGLRPTGRTLTLVTADGTEVKAKEMVIRTARIGRLTVKDVTCVVLPKEKGDVAPLLGQSILARFDLKYTPGAGRLVLTKIEPDEPATPSKKAGASARKRKGR